MCLAALACQLIFFKTPGHTHRGLLGYSMNFHDSCSGDFRCQNLGSHEPPVLEGLGRTITSALVHQALLNVLSWKI